MNLPLYVSAILAGIAIHAKAETITLAETPCGGVRNCINVANDAGADIDLYASTAYPKASIYIDGQGPYVGPNSLNGPLDGVFYTTTGEWVQLSGVTFESHRKLTKPWTTTWKVTGGTVTRP